MKRSLRPLLAWAFKPAFTAVFGCISLFGQGLHTLVEHAEHGPAAHTSCSHAGHDHAAHSVHDGGHKHTDIAGFSDDRSHQHDDCPICGFFAQAQHALAAFEICATAACLPLEPLANDVARATHVGSYQSRGPPLS